MHFHHFSCSKRCIAALALALTAALPLKAASGEPVPLPAVSKALTNVTVAGEGQMRFLGVRIYDARLWVGPQFDANMYAAHPLALELTYYLSFTGAAIAQRSIEEIQRQRPVTPEQATAWQGALARLLPDVRPGDRLTGLYLPDQGMWLWHGSQELGTIRDAELAQLFFGIWLSSRTSEPRLRNALLSRSPGTAP